MIRKVIQILLLSFVAGMSGCVSHHTERVADVNPMGWYPTDKLDVVFPNDDSLSVYDLYIVIRYDVTYAAESIPLDIEVLTPDSTGYSERFEAVFVPMEEIAGNYVETDVPSRVNTILGQKGNYIFTFSPSRSTVEGITAIGLKSFPVGGKRTAVDRRQEH